MRAAAIAVLVESTVADCVAVSGGGLYVDQSNVTLQSGSRIERCAASHMTESGRGGAILAFQSEVALLEGSAISVASGSSKGWR